MLTVIPQCLPVDSSLSQGLSLKLELAGSPALAVQSSEILCLCLPSNAMPGKSTHLHEDLQNLLCLVVLVTIFLLLYRGVPGVASPAETQHCHLMLC